MSGILNTSKKIQKPYSRVKLNRTISKILSESNNEISEQINAYWRGRDTHFSVRTADPQMNIPNRKDDLRMWVLNHNISRRSVNDLLKILNCHGLNWLPMDSRTLCKTPRFTSIARMAGGQYWYNGIDTNIRSLFADLQCNLSLQLNINVDGIPLMKSSSTQFWPILANIHSELKNNHIEMFTIRMNK